MYMSNAARKSGAKATQQRQQINEVLKQTALSSPIQPFFRTQSFAHLPTEKPEMDQWRLSLVLPMFS